MQVGQWGAPFSIPIFGIHAVMLPTGKVMWWAYPFGTGEPRQNTSEAWLWNPATGTSNRVDPPQVPDPDNPGQTIAANIWCSGQMLLADGRVLVTGGNLDYQTGGPPNDWKGLDKVYTFNPFNETWTEQPEMAHGRWYPSQVLQPDGRVVIMDGFDENGSAAKNKSIELFTPSPDMNGVGTITTIATRGQAGQPTDQGELYPRNFVMPSGRTLVAGPEPVDTWWYQVGPAPGNTFTWGEIPNFSGADSRLWSTTVLEPGGPAGSSKVTVAGGTPFAGGAQRTAETFDDANQGLGWQPAPSLNIGRSHFNTVLLPDGSKVAVGGGTGNGAQGLYTFQDQQRQIEIFDPATNTWRLGASQAEGRAYHSTAVLLPDGRVISAGDNFNGTIGQSGGDRTDTAEIFSPPYLFKSARPAISAAPASVAWGDTFGINSPDAVSRAVLMAPSATTHGYDMNQRHVELQVTGTVAGTGINVVSPPNARVAPPGYYMLFLLNADGVPSVSRWVRVDPSAPDRPTVGGGGPPPRTLTVTPPTGTGTGTITGTGINCPGDCTETYADGSAVTLTANPAAGSTFAGWSGDCTGTGTCALTMNANKAVSGAFNTSGGGTGGTSLLRPNADITSQWTVCCTLGTPAWDALNESVTQAQASIPAELFIYGAALNTTTEVALTNAPLNGVPAPSRAWFYMNTAPGQSVRADVIWGGAIRGSTTVAAGQGYQWRSVTVTPPDQAAADDLRIRFTVTTAGSSSGNVFATYFELVSTAGGGGPPPRTLTVTPPTGTGTGTITGTGINCPGDCTETYADGSAVTLTANPAAGSTFAGWSGDCTGTGTCALTMNANKAVSGSFTTTPPPPRTLTVTPPTGTGTGTITGTGINCPGDCTETYADGSAVTLTANPAAGSTFAGWSGDCTGTGTCALTMNANKAVSGSFTTTPPPPRTLTVTPPTGTGTGTITGTGINCPGDCTETYADGSAVTLTANPAAGSTFAGWSGDCTGTGTCALTMNANKAVSGSFTTTPPPPRTLTVTPPTGTGTGTITGTGINCPGDCTETYADGSAVTLTANPAAGSTFAGWSGDCTGTGTCALTMNANKAVSGAFNTSGGGTGGTSLLRPNADITSQWTVCCTLGTPAWDALNESVTQAQASIPAELFIYGAALNTTTEVALTNAPLNGVPAPSRAWFYMNTAPGQSVRADVIWGGAIRGSTTVAAGQGYQWRSVTVTPPDQAAADDLRIRFTVTTAGSSSGNVFATYFELVSTAGGGGPPPRTLTVTPPTGTGTGTITGTGINCPGDCTETYADGSAVTLTANPAAGSTFAGWSGDCTGTGTCALTMNANKAVSGSFTTTPPPPRTLTVTPPTGTGTGTITGTGINCPGDCTETYADGSAVTLTANPAAGSTFAGWSGDCTGTGTCALTMNANKAVSGAFNTSGGGTGGTSLLRPNADITSQWTVCCTLGTPAWDALNESVTQAQASIPAELFIYGAALNTTTEVALTNAPLNGVPAPSRAWFYMNTAPGQSVRADVIWGGAIRGSTTVAAGQGYQWRSVTVTPPDQAAADDLRIRFTVTTAGSSSGNVFATYFELVSTAG